jgi:hypothetical protein
MSDSTIPAPHQPHRRAVLGTLMPHLAAERHHVYRNVTALALLGALVAAGFGSLAVALVLAAVALPAAVLVYIHDHRLWHDEPITLIAVAFALSLLLGIAVGWLETQFITVASLGTSRHHLPPFDHLLQVGLLVPLAAFAASLIAPLVVSARPAFRHPMDLVVACSLSGAALSLGLSITVQHGAFTHIQATAGDPAHVAFIALTLGFLQPIILATAATLGVVGLRSQGVNLLTGVLEGLVLVFVYEAATTLLQPHGTRGIVLTALIAFVLAGAGLAAVNHSLHAAIAADTTSDAVAPEPAEHRLSAGLIAAVAAIVVVIAAGASIAAVNGGPATRPAPPGDEGRDGIATHKAATTGAYYGIGRPADKHWGSVALASTSTPLALGTGTAVKLTNGVSLTPAPGWTVAQQGGQTATLYNGDKSAGVFAAAGSANASDITQESAMLINGNIKGDGLTNVQQTPGQVQAIQGKTFDQLLEVDFTADVQTDQGTMQIWGGWVTLYSSARHASGLFDYFAGSQAAFKASLQDAGQMMASMQ